MRAENTKVTHGGPRRQRAADSILRTLAGLIPAILAGWSLACAPETRVQAQADAAPASTVRTGLDVLVRDGAGPLAGRRVGLITNHTGIDATGRSNIDILHAHPELELVALFSPEHAITGRAAPGEHVASGHDPRTGLPVHSLYGAVRRPTAEMLEGIDVLIFDIQDIGTRYYTYVWTMAEALAAAAEHDVDFVVLDRPNPLGGTITQGNVLDPDFRTFVGLYPVPMRHGMTPGELARFVNGEYGVGARLTVVPVEGWSRSAWFEATGLPWVPPSPNMPDVEAATHYPGTCLFEGTNLSVGRGTEAAFRQIGAPWLDAEALVGRLERQRLPGVRFEAVTFTPIAPGDGMYADTPVRGIRLVTTDRATYDPARAGIALLVEIHALHGDVLTFRQSHFDRLAGTDRVRTMILAGEDVNGITATWPAELAAFTAARQPYLLYR
jgi:uncharacterized protein YbbC (DUF1343 family)